MYNCVQFLGGGGRYEGHIMVHWPVDHSLLNMGSATSRGQDKTVPVAQTVCAARWPGGYRVSSQVAETVLGAGRPVGGCDLLQWTLATSGSPQAQRTGPSRSGTWPLAN